MTQPRPKVVIVGAGFGGLMAAKSLARAPVDVTLIDRQNHHCFQPLLYQVATAALSPAEIAWPIRHILRKQENATVLMADVTGLEVSPGDEVMIIGAQETDQIDVREMAARIGTIPYEILCRIGTRIERVYD